MLEHEAERPTALLLRHMTHRHPDRLELGLRGRGLRLEERCPAHGDGLPDGLESLDLCIVYGGPQSANDAHPYVATELRFIERWLATGKPLLGLCLGAQLLARVLGAPVARHRRGIHEIGFVRVRPTVGGRRVMPAPMSVYQWHNEGFGLPVGAELLAVGDTFENQMFCYGGRAFGLQFHPEVTGSVMREWMDEVGHMLSAPGAHSRERQLEDARRFEQPMGAWLDDFVATHLLPDRALGSSGGASGAGLAQALSARARHGE